MNKLYRAQSPPPSVVKPVGQPASSQPNPKPAAPPVYRPQSAPKVLQGKVAPGWPSPAAAAKCTTVAPEVYRPQAAPKVLQRKVAPGVKAEPVAPHACATHSAPRAGSPAPHAQSPGRAALVQPKSASPQTRVAPESAGRIPPAQVGAPPRVPGVIQRMEDRRAGDERGHNLDIISRYSPDIFKQIRDAFMSMGYTLYNWLSAAKKALKGTSWHKSTIAHGLGGTTSGSRGGTDADIRECAEYLIGWAGNNPYQEKPKDKSRYGSHNNKDDKGKKDDDNNNSNGGGGYTYKAPWHGGPPSWVSRRTDT